MQLSRFGRGISILYRLQQRYLNCVLRPYDLGYSSYNFLLYLANNPGCSQRKMCEELVMDEALATRAMRRLEQSGYIERRRPNDARTYVVYLTPQGEALVPVIRAVLAEWWEHLTAGMESGQMEEIFERLEQMAALAPAYLHRIEKERESEDVKRVTDAEFPGNRKN